MILLLQLPSGGITGANHHIWLKDIVPNSDSNINCFSVNPSTANKATSAPKFFSHLLPEAYRR
jgi:hypothetical protein